MIIRPAVAGESQAIGKVLRSAFGRDEGELLADQVQQLLADPSAQPALSLVAIDRGEVVGHVLFTAARLGSEQVPMAALLAPLAVRKGHQGQGIGGRLIDEGLSLLRLRGVGLVFVLGYPDYYPRHGFAPSRQVSAPYPIAEENADAWMVQALQPGLLEGAGGQLVVADAWMQPAFWLP